MDVASCCSPEDLDSCWKRGILIAWKVERGHSIPSFVSLHDFIKEVRADDLAAMVTHDDVLFMSYGVMGGAMQPQGHLQVLV